MKSHEGLFGGRRRAHPRRLLCVLPGVMPELQACTWVEVIMPTSELQP